MEQLIPYLPIGLMALFISGLIAVNKEIAKRPTFKETDDKYTEIKLCNEMHKRVDEKLDCIPEIKKTVTQIETKIDILLKNNGY